MTRETESKKKRKKLKNDPSRMRGSFGDIDTFERKTPTLKGREKKKANKHKNKLEWNSY